MFARLFLKVSMIRFIVAVDEKRGMANDHGIPWAGKIPSDVEYFRDLTKHATVLMGYGTYVEFDKPLSLRRNLVATTKDEQLRPGFKPVHDAIKFLKEATENIWVIGGAGLFQSTLPLADELHITQLEGDFHCTKLFPEYEQSFICFSQSEPITENDITFRITVWRRKRIKVTG